MKIKRRTKAAMQRDRQWQAEVLLLLDEFGLKPHPRFEGEYQLETGVGLLDVKVYPRDRFVACRFLDADRAKVRFGGMWGQMNPHSGKWNFHHSDISTEASLQELCTRFESAMRPDHLFEKQP